VFVSIFFACSIAQYALQQREGLLKVYRYIPATDRWTDWLSSRESSLSDFLCVFSKIKKATEVAFLSVAKRLN
jgi:hypothetical protein